MVAFAGCDGCVVANNTMIEPRGYVGWIVEENLQGQPSRNGHFINNLIVADNGHHLPNGGYLNIGGNVSPESFSAGNNLFHCVDCSGEFEPQADWDSRIIDQDSLYGQAPLLLDYAGGDYRVSSSSPAVSAGRAVPMGLGPDHALQVYSDPPSIGAWESQ